MKQHENRCRKNFRIKISITWTEVLWGTRQVPRTCSINRKLNHHQKGTNGEDEYLEVKNKIFFCSVNDALHRGVIILAHDNTAINETIQMKPNETMGEGGIAVQYFMRFIRSSSRYGVGRYRVRTRVIRFKNFFSTPYGNECSHPEQ